MHRKNLQVSDKFFQQKSVEARYQRGITLIELVVVITILSILSVIAIPLYIDTRAEAKNSTLLAMQSSVKGAVRLVFSQSALKGTQHLRTSSSNTLNINGNLVSIKYGTPLADYSTRPGSWDDLVAINRDVFMTTVLQGHFVIYFKNDPVPTHINNDCLLAYQQSNGLNTSPNIRVNPC